MLRLLVLALLLGNVGYFAWTKNLLAPYGFAPATQSEPQRLAQQIRPEAMRLLTVPTGPSASAGVPATECLQVGLFNEAQTAVLRERLQSALPPGSWVLESSVDPARWMLYMGKYGGPEALEKKRSELRARRVSFEPVNNPLLEPGLSLGNFSSKAEADAEMARVVLRGVRTSRVIQTTPEVRGQKLKLPAVNAALRPQLEALKPQLAGKVLQTCT